MRDNSAYRNVFGDDNFLDLTSKRARVVAFRTAQHGSDGSAKSGGRSSHNSRLGNMAKLDQAMVKIVRNGGVQSLKQLGQQMDYIEKEGEAELTVNNDGIPYSNTDAEFAEEMDAWADDFRHMGRGRKTYHVVVSFPQHTDQGTAAEIGREVAEAITNGALGDSYRTLHAHHTDTKHPHTHIIINKLGETGRMLNIHPKSEVTVDRLRQLQVDIAREHGVYLNASRRHTRPNRAEKPISLGRHHAQKEGRSLPDRPLSPSRAEERYQTEQRPLVQKALFALKASDAIIKTKQGAGLSKIFERMSDGMDAGVEDKKKLAIMSDSIAKKASEYIKARNGELNAVDDPDKKKRAKDALKKVANALGPIMPDHEQTQWGFDEVQGGIAIDDRASEIGRGQRKLKELSRGDERDDDRER